MRTRRTRNRSSSGEKARPNGPATGLLSANQLESQKETLAILSNRDFMTEIRKGLKLLRKRKARLYTLEELFDR